MKSDGGFLVEDFINAITSQLDRVQDSLRLKAVNRPLTYALKDLALELEVFVEMDEQGNVRFRTSGPNETGSSTVRLGFTTITKPMIEENTISLAATRSPSLNELGLGEGEQRRLEQLGVRNAAQLLRLGSSTGANTVSRLSGISVERLHQALQQGRPQIKEIKAGRGSVKLAAPPTASAPARPVDHKSFILPTLTPNSPRIADKVDPPLVHQDPRFQPAVGVPSVVRPATGGQLFPPQAGGKIVDRPTPPLKVAPNTKHLHLLGNNLIGERGAPEVRLNNKLLGLAEADDDRIVVELPQSIESGALEVTLPDGQTMTYDLSLAFEPENELSYEGNEGDEQRGDPWQPGRSAT